MHIYDLIRDRLPKSYPRPKLAFYEDEQSLSENLKIKVTKEECLYAVCDPDTMTIMMPMNMTFITININGKESEKITPLNKMDEDDIAQTLLHEIAHIYAGQKYGYESKQYHNEKYCDRFANRWVRTLKKEKLIE